MSFPQLPFGGLKSRRLIFLTSEVPLGAIASDSRISRVSLLNSEVPLGAIASNTTVQRVIELTSDVPLGAIGSNSCISRVIDLTSEVPLGAIGSEAIVEDPSPPWTPSDISTKLWLDAFDFSTIAQSSNIVSQWNDKSGMNQHVAQSNPSLRPTYSPSGFNGLPAIQFLTNVWLDSLSNFSLSGNPNITIIACYKKTADSGHILGIGDIHTDILMVYDDINFRGVLYASGNHGFSIPTTGDIILSYEKPVGAINLSNAYIDGAFRVPISSSSNTPNIAAAPIRIGSSKFSWLFGSLAEIIIINNVDTTTRQKAEGYLAHKWGLTANLPSDHPYKTNPPTA